MLKLLEKYHITALLIAIVIAFVIFYLSSKSFSKTGILKFSLIAYFYHYFAFFFLSFFLIIYFVRGAKSRVYFIFVAVLLSIIYAFSDEIHQFFVPGRSFSYRDILTDSIGIFCAGIIYRLKMKNLF
jgi:VanZ family protein